MHIAFVHASPSPRGGAERVVVRSAAALRDRGHRATLLYGLEEPLDPGFVGAFDAAFPLVDPRAQLTDADVVYAHGLVPGFDVPALAAADKPVVRFLHDHALVCPRAHKYRSWDLAPCRAAVGPRCLGCAPLRRVEGGLELVPLRRVRRELRAHRAHARLLVGSAYLAAHARDNGLSAVETVPLFVEPSEGPAAERRRTHLVFAGALLRSKGLDVVFEAMSVARLRFTLDVYGEGRQEGWLRDRAARLGLTERVFFAGRVPDLGPAFAAAGAVVMASRTPETFGLVGAEALAQGTPVVTTAVGGVGEWAVPGRTAWTVPANDPRALAAALDAVAGAPERAAAVAAEGRRFVRRRFTLARHVDAVEAALTAAAATRRAA